MTTINNKTAEQKVKEKISGNDLTREQAIKQLDVYLKEKQQPFKYGFLLTAIHQLLAEGRAFPGGFFFFDFIGKLEMLLTLPEIREVFESINHDSFTDHGIETAFKELKRFFAQCDTNILRAEIYRLGLDMDVIEDRHITPAQIIKEVLFK